MAQQLVSYNGQTAIISLPHCNYVDKVLRSNSFDVLWSRFKPADSPAKEISESFAAFSTMKKVCKVSDYTWIHIGDGAYTRTAAIFAFFSKSFNFSIDPAINVQDYHNWREKFKVENIWIMPCKFEDVSEYYIKSVLGYQGKYNICLVHSHVNLMEVDKQYPNWNYLYTNYCCFPVKQTFSKKYMEENGIVPILEKVNLGILSKKRDIIVYKKLHQNNI